MSTDEPTRRELLRSIAGATLALALLRCGTTSARQVAVATPSRGPELEVDPSFAEGVLDRLRSSAAEVAPALVEHASVALLCGHREMVSGNRPSAGALLEEILASDIDSDGAAGVLEHWRGRHELISSVAAEDSAFLPRDLSLESTIHFIVGYDIGIATSNGARSTWPISTS